MKLLITLLVGLFSLTALADKPWIPELDKELNDRATYTAHAVWDATQHGAVGNNELLMKIPSGAIITKGYIVVKTKPVSPGLMTQTFALKAQTAGDLFAQEGITDWSVGRIQGLIAAGTTATMITLTAERTLTATVAGTSTFTAGKFDIFVEYMKATH